MDRLPCMEPGNSEHGKWVVVDGWRCETAECEESWALGGSIIAVKLGVPMGRAEMPCEVCAGCVKGWPQKCGGCGGRLLLSSPPEPVSLY